MGQLLQFKPREIAPPPAPPRSIADDDHDAALWMAGAEPWGWKVNEFRTEDPATLDFVPLTGYLLEHAAGGKVPLYTLIRSEDGWRCWTRERVLTEHETLHAALQAVFPTDLTAGR